MGSFHGIKIGELEANNFEIWGGSQNWGGTFKGGYRDSIGLYRGYVGFRVSQNWVPIIRTIVYLGVFWGPLIQGNYHLGC